MRQCLGCGQRIGDDYLYCIPCDRKRMKIFSNLVGSGYSTQDAIKKLKEIVDIKYQNQKVNS